MCIWNMRFLFWSQTNWLIDVNGTSARLALFKGIVFIVISYLYFVVFLLFSYLFVYLFLHMTL